MNEVQNNPTDTLEESVPQEAELAPLPPPQTAPQEDDPEVSLDPLKRHAKFSWKSFGGEGFIFSLVFHGVLLLVALFLVMRHISNKVEEDPDAFVTGAGGGNNGSEAKIQQHRMKPRNARDMVKSKSRIASKSASATIALPEMPQMQTSSSFSTGMTAGGDSSGFGGGSGGGVGTGQGIGVGNGRNFVSAFGSSFQRPADMVGTLFDLKRGEGGGVLANTNHDNAGKRKAQLHKALRILDTKKWNVKELEKVYYKAPTKLYNSRIFIVAENGQALRAERATEAFADENGKAPFSAPGWLCYYEGYFSVPENGEYRFVGMGDDAMIVGVERKTVFYAYWPGEGHGPAIAYRKGWEPVDHCGKGGRDGNNLNARGQRSSLYKGNWINLQAGKRYKVQIAFGEAAGGLAGATLGLQQKGKDTDDNFPMFSLEPFDAPGAWGVNQGGRYNTSRNFMPKSGAGIGPTRR